MRKGYDYAEHEPDNSDLLDEHDPLDDAEPTDVDHAYAARVLARAHVRGDDDAWAAER